MRTRRLLLGRLADNDLWAVVSGILEPGEQPALAASANRPGRPEDQESWGGGESFALSDQTWGHGEDPGGRTGCSDAGGAGGSRWIAGGRSEGPWPWWPASWSSGCFPVPAGATTYTVTSTSLCGGAGTFEQALKDANANPGADTISFTPGLVVDASSCTTPGPRPFPFATFATESVNIVGNGVTVEGNQLYTAGNGQVNVPGTCPTHDATTTQMFDEPGLLPFTVTVAVTDHPVTEHQQIAVTHS